MAGGMESNAQINLPLSIVVSFITTVIPIAGFYFLTNWRLKRLEKSEDKLTQASQEVRDKLTELNTILNYIKERLA